MCTAINTQFLVLISYAEWLIPLSTPSLGGSCRHSTSSFRSTHVSDVCMAHIADLVQLCWMASSAKCNLVAGSLQECVRGGGV
jgi:hypothetical protein